MVLSEVERKEADMTVVFLSIYMSPVSIFLSFVLGSQHAQPFRITLIPTQSLSQLQHKATNISLNGHGRLPEHVCIL